MKKLIIPTLLLLTVWACSTNEDPGPASCQPTKVEQFDGSTTIYTFGESFNGVNLLSSVTIDDGTTMNYVYNEDMLDKITIDDDGFVLNYNATYDGDKLIKLSGVPQGFGLVFLESRLVYNGNNVQKWEDYISDQTTGVQYLFQHYEFEYSSGNLASSKWYLDENVLQAIIYQTVPDDYSPANRLNIEYGYGDQDAPNPLYGYVNVLNPEMSNAANIPTTMVYKDADGSILGSIGYELTFNELGYPTLANNPDSYLDMEYDCN